MPYSDHKRQLEYQRQWRRKHKPVRPDLAAQARQLQEQANAASGVFELTWVVRDLATLVAHLAAK